MRFQKIILHKKNRSGFRKSDKSERFFCVLRVTFLRFAWQATAMLRRNIGKNLQRNRFSGDCKNIFTKK